MTITNRLPTRDLKIDWDMKGVDNIVGTDNVAGRAPLGRVSLPSPKSEDLNFIKIKNRHEFMDKILDYIKEKKEVEYNKIQAHFQYVTGASQKLIHESIIVLEELGLIKHKEVKIGNGMYSDTYFVE